ncbi:MAG: CotH kinase family protein [Acidobacteriota bacterium]|nr:CotH kinase family protein [Acidobacteriota bacterium]
MSSPRARSVAAGLLAVVLLLSSCSASTSTSTGTGATSTATMRSAAAGGALFDVTRVHTISLTVDEAVLADVLTTYVSSGDKKWASADVTIDGQQFQNVGIKLKGNSSLRGVTADTDPATLPWRIRLDKYVDGQNLDGYTDITVRSNNTETSLNEAVALDLLTEAGLASQEAMSTRFSVNGGAEELRLTVQSLNGDWVEQNFPEAGADSILYKAESEGDWSWRGADGDYSGAFDIEAGLKDYTPLIELLDLLNNGTQTEINEKLPQMVDLDSFASYLAFQDLINNFDDIDGPGNNSYLFWDSATKKFTIVSWDHNLAFGADPGGNAAGGMGRGADGAMPGGVPSGALGRPNTGGADRPAPGDWPSDVPSAPNQDPSWGATPPAGVPEPGADQGQGLPGAGGGTMPGGQSNPLVTAFNANTEWQGLYTSEMTRLRTELVTSGQLSQIVDARAAVLTEQASDLVSSETVTSEASAIIEQTKANG